MLSQICEPHVLDAMKSSTPLVADVIQIIGSYYITLYDFSLHGSTSWETRLSVLSQQTENINEFLDNQTSSLIGTFDDRGAVKVQIDFWHEGEMPIKSVLCQLKNQLFLYRTTKLDGIAKATACWLFSTRLEPLLGRMTKEHYITFLNYQHTCQLREELILIPSD